MLPSDKAERIKALLKEGKLSKRAISRQEKVARVTVDRLAKELLPPEKRPPQIKIVHFDERDNKVHGDNRPVYNRCKGCGGMQQVGVPCLVCQVRHQQISAYDCYMDDLLSPSSLSPLSSKRREAAKKGA